MMKITNRLDFRHIVIILVLVVLLYWLLLPSGKQIVNKHQHHPSKNVNKEHNEVEKELEAHVKPPTHNPYVEKLQQQIDELKQQEHQLKEENEKQKGFHKQEAEKLKDELKQKSEDVSLLKKENENLKQGKQEADKVLKTLKKEIEEKDKKTADAMKSLDNKIITVSADSDATQKKNLELLEKVKISTATTPFNGLKLVHLDLKGAPPKINYLIDFIKFSKELGASGFLIEYEDMFPWKGDLSVLARPNAYSEADIEHILSTAKDADMEVIPLVQTFGHLEFVLKHKQFSHLRANKEISNSVSALNKKSVPFVKKLIDQIVELHPDSKWIHLGGDEVWNIRTCEECLSRNMSDAELFTHHMVPLLKYVASKKTTDRGAMKPIIWDDMMRRWPVGKLMEMKELAIPMVWAYVANLATYHHFPKDMWVRYTQVFPEIWLASSFKGALKPWSNVVPIQQHLDNHISWLKIITRLAKKKVTVRGIALTGWSRFDHYGPLCELLPAGIPCLALCLSILQKGAFSEELHLTVSQKLGFKEPFKIGVTNFKGYTPEMATSFQGADVFHLVGSVEKAVGWKDWSSVREIGWARPYHLKEKFISFYAMNVTILGMNTSLDLLRQSKEKAQLVLKKYFEDDVIKEWIADKIDYQSELASASIIHIKDVIKKNEF